MTYESPSSCAFRAKWPARTQWCRSRLAPIRCQQLSVRRANGREPRRPRARPKKVGRIFGPRRWIRKKLAAFSALGGRFLRFPIDDRSATERTRALTVPAGKARPSLINARPARALDQKNLATLSVPAGVFFGLDSTGKVIPR